MSPAREVPALDPGLAVATLRWIDRLDLEYGSTICRVARKLAIHCASLGIDRIEISDSRLAAIVGVPRDYVRAAAYALERELSVRKTAAGRVWRVPAGMIDLPAQEGLPFPTREDDSPLFAVENRRPQDTYDRPQFSLLSSSPGGETRQDRRLNGEQVEVKPGNGCGKARHPLRDWLRPPEQRPQNQQIQTSGLENQACGLENQARRVEVNSNKLEGPQSLRSAVTPSASEDLPEFDGPSLGRGVVDRIVAARTVDNPDDAATIAACLSSHMRKFGPPDRNTRSYEDLLKDDVLLARIAAIAPLGGPDEYGTLLYTFRQLDLEFKPCGREYGWFVATIANRIHGTNRHELAHALDKARPRRKPKPRTPSLESAPPAQTQDREFRDSLLHQVAGAGRRMP